MRFRRRPLMTAAVVGGAYHMGKKGQQAQQDAQQQAPQQQAPQAPAASEEDKMAQLKQLKELLDSGVLTQAEFDAQKERDPAEHVAGGQPPRPLFSVKEDDQWHWVLYRAW